MKQKNLLKIAMLFVFAIISNFSYCQGTETFTGITGNVSSYLSRSWTGDDGSTWTATNARVSEDINGDAITLNDDKSDTYVQSGTISGGIGDITISTQRKFSGGSSVLSVFINDVKVGTVPVETAITTTTISNINVSGDIVIKLWNDTGGSSSGGADRVGIDDVVWTAFTGIITPTVTFDTETSSVNEADIDVVTTGIPVTLTNYAAGVTITPTVNGASTADPADYTIDLTPIVFGADETKNIPLTIHHDDDFINGTIIIDFTVTDGTADLGTSQHTVTITDDEVAPSIGFDTATSSETETDTTFNVLIPVTVSDYSGTQIDVSIAASGTADVADYTLNTASLTFTADGSQNVSLDINDDADSDIETVILTITETSTVTGLVISQDTHTVTIIDNDIAPGISLPYTIDFTSVDPFSNDWTAQNIAGTSTWAYTNGTGVSMNAYTDSCTAEDWLISPAFNLDTAANEILSYDFSQQYGSTAIEIYYSNDYIGTGDPNTATWTLIESVAAQSSTGTIVEISSENLTTLQGVAGTNVYIAFKYDTNADCSNWIVENFTLETASLTPNVTFDAETTSVNETDVDVVTTGIPVTFTNYNTDVTITPTVNGSSTADPSDYTIILTPLTFSANETLSIPLTIHDDADFIDETIIIDFTVTTGTADLGTSQHTVTITDDEVAPSIGFDAATSTESETDATFNVLIPVTVSDYSGTQIDVSIAASGTADVADYTLNTASLTFTADGSKNVSLDINDDADTDNETVILTITETSTVTGLVISQATHTVTIADNETPNYFVEDFTNSNATGGYNDNSFLGNNNITWTYVESRDENGDANGAGIVGNALMLRNSGSKVTSSTITGGIGDFSVKLYKGFTSSGDRQVELFINSVSKGTSIAFDDADDKDAYTFAVDDINVTGDIIIELRNITGKQIIVDDITWSPYSPTTITWDGSDSSDWATAANWDTNTVPTSADNVIIPDVATAPIIGTSTGAEANDLTITETDGVTISSGGSLIVSGTSSGNVTYNRTLAYDADKTKAWYLVSSPVNGEIMTDMISNNTFATSGANIGFAPYDNSQADSNDRWSYFGSGATDALVNGKGYTAKLGAAGDLSFTGTLNTGDVAIGLTQGSNNFNLIGNPYASYINSGTFLTTNTDELVQEEIYIWNQGTGQYDTQISGDSFKIAPGQGFFVEAKTTNDVTFTTALQSNEASDTFQKSATRPEVQLFMNNGDASRYLKVYYIDGTTTGFDNGYDGKLFGGVPQPFALYSHLVSDSKGENFQIQSLPNSDLETMVIPVGIIADAGKEITFTAQALNLPSELKVFLEDREANSYTRLDEANANYKVTLDEALNGVGRFFLHTSAKSTLNIEAVSLDNISIYNTNNSNLRIVGLSQGKANIKLFNILGKQVLNTTFTSNGVQDISLPNLATGIYIVQLETEAGKLNKKITLE